MILSLSWDEFQPWWSGLAPVVTLVLGYAGTLMTEGRRDTRARNAVREDRQEAASELAGARRRDFELEHLLSAEAALRTLRLGLPGPGSVNVNDDFKRANFELGRESGYILDPEIRTVTDNARKSLVQLAFAMDSGEIDDSANAQYEPVVDEATSAEKAIQARVRAIYDESVTTS